MRKGLLLAVMALLLMLGGNGFATAEETYGYCGSVEDYIQDLGGGYYAIMHGALTPIGDWSPMGNEMSGVWTHDNPLAGLWAEHYGGAFPFGPAHNYCY